MQQKHCVKESFQQQVLVMEHMPTSRNLCDENLGKTKTRTMIIYYAPVSNGQIFSAGNNTKQCKYTAPHPNSSPYKCDTQHSLCL